MKKLITITLMVLATVLSQSKGYATPIQYGITGTIRQTSNPKVTSVKVGDQVTLYFNIEPEPYTKLSDHNVLYSPSPMIHADVYFFRGNTFYHHASYDPKINSDEFGIMMVLELGAPAQIWYYIYQPLVSISHVPHSGWRVNYLHFDLQTLLDDPRDSSLPVDFRLADGKVEEFTVGFKDDGNSILTVEIRPDRIVLDKPNSL